MSIEDTTDLENHAVAEFARGIMRYFEDGNCIELHECGCIQELKDAIALDPEPSEDDEEEEELMDRDSLIGAIEAYLDSLVAIGDTSAIEAAFDTPNYNEIALHELSNEELQDIYDEYIQDE